MTKTITIAPVKKTVTVVVQLPAAVVAVDVLIANLRNNFVFECYPINCAAITTLITES